MFWEMLKTFMETLKKQNNNQKYFEENLTEKQDDHYSLSIRILFQI